MVYGNSFRRYCSKALFLALILTLAVAFMPALTDTAVYGASKSSSKKADVGVSQLTAKISLKGLSKKSLKKYRYVKLTWNKTGSSSATCYKVYVAKGKFGFYHKVKEVKDPHAKIKVKKGYYRIKVKAFHKNTAGHGSIVTTQAGKHNATAITFSALPEQVVVGQTASIKASANGSVDHNVTLKVKNSKILAIKDGVISAKKTGTTTITAIAHNGVRTTVTVTVIPKYPKTVTINQDSQTVVVGQRTNLTASTSSAGDTSLTWHSSKSSVAKVSKRGSVRAVKAGTATISATAKADDGDTAASSAITIKVIPQYPTKVTLSTTSAQSLKEGKTLQLSATASEAGDMNLTWTSSKKSVATVTSTGKVKAVGVGSTTIKVKANAESGKTAASAKVTINVTGDLEGMVLWAEKIAKNNKFGYSMGTNLSASRDRYCYYCYGSKASKDYDCASFVAAAVAHGYGGSSIMNAYCKNSGGCTTLYNTLKKAGWKDKGKLSISKLKRGDILINPSSHVEIYTGEKDSNGNVLSVAAHDDYDGKTGDSTGREISIAPTKYFSNYTHVLRLE